MVLCTSTLLVCIGVADTRDALSIALAANQAARDMVRSCECQYRVERSRPGPPAVTRVGVGEFVADGDKWRCSVVVDSAARHDYVSRGGRSWSLVEHKGRSSKSSGASVRAQDYWTVPLDDPFTFGLFNAPLPDGKGFAPIGTLAAKATDRRLVSGRVAAGEDVRLVLTLPRKPTETCSSATWDVHIRLSAGANYLADEVMTRVVTTAGRTITQVYTVSEFAEPQPGVYFPKKGDVRVTSDDKVILAGTSQVGRVVVNAPVLPRRFELDFPEGVHFTDFISGTQYKADRAGKATSAPVPLTPPDPQTTGSSPPPTPVSGSPTDQEPPEPAAWRWLFAASAGGLVLAAVVAARRRSRRP